MPIYLTPGPSHPYPKLREFIDSAWNEDVISWSHRSTQFTDLYTRTQQALRSLMNIPENYRILFVGSATEAMERTIQGLVREHSHHIVLGAFGEKWQQVATQLGKQTSSSKLKPDTRLFSEQISIPASAELLCVTLNETSIGATMPPYLMSRLSQRLNNRLLALDIVSAAPLIDVDWHQIDIAFFSVQKAFGLPAGLGVIVMNEPALKRAEVLTKDGIITGSYHSLPSLASASDKSQTPETPNVLGIYLLMRVAEDMLNRGPEKIRIRTKERAEQLYGALDKSNSFRPIIEADAWRSPTIIVADTTQSNTQFLAHLKQHNLIAGKGYAPEHKERQLRIANFPAVSDQDFDALVGHVQSWSTL